MEDELIDKSLFNQLWEINPNYSENKDHNPEATRELLSNIINLNLTTNDGKKVDFNLIYERYKRHVQIRTMINEGQDPKYIKKENKVLGLFKYLFDGMYQSVDKIPETNRHLYFWDTYTAEEIVERFQKFNTLLNG